MDKSYQCESKYCQRHNPKGYPKVLQCESHQETDNLQPETVNIVFRGRYTTFPATDNICSTQVSCGGNHDRSRSTMGGTNDTHCSPAQNRLGYQVNQMLAFKILLKTLSISSVPGSHADLVGNSRSCPL